MSNKPNTTLSQGKHWNGLGLKAAALDLGINAYFNVKNGDNLGNALLKGAGEAALWAVAPGAMAAVMTAQMVPALATANTAVNKALQDKYNQAVRPGANFQYKDTRQAMTMRQAAVQAIQGSKLNARNALGGEAALMHRSYRTDF